MSINLPGNPAIEGYFDHNATTPLSPAARSAWLEAQDKAWQNPSSLYPDAARVDHLLDAARLRIAEAVGCEAPERIVFTSGATEANNALCTSFAQAFPNSVVATGSTEHPSVMEPSRAGFGERALRLGLDSDGNIDLDDLARRLSMPGDRKDAAPVSLVSVMAANNEVGTLQPWKKISQLCRKAGVAFHSDAVQWVGKLPGEGLGDACDYLSASAHKFGGPKGVGFLIVPEDDAVFRCALGGPQEAGRRAGTENYPAIAAMVAALEQASHCLPAASCFRDAFEEQVLGTIPGSRVIGHRSKRLWNTSMIAFSEVRNTRILTALARSGFQVSTGSACSAGKGRPSTVLAAMGEPPETMGEVLRFSSGSGTTSAQWRALADQLAAILKGASF